MFPYKHYGKEGNTDIVEEGKCEYDENTKKVFSNVVEEALTFEEGNMKLRRESTVYALVEAVHCEYEEATKKASIDMDV